MKIPRVIVVDKVVESLRAYYDDRPGNRLHQPLRLCGEETAHSCESGTDRQDPAFGLRSAGQALASAPSCFHSRKPTEQLRHAAFQERVRRTAGEKQFRRERLRRLKPANRPGLQFRQPNHCIGRSLAPSRPAGRYRLLRSSARKSLAAGNISRAAFDYAEILSPSQIVAGRLFLGEATLHKFPNNTPDRQTGSARLLS